MSERSETESERDLDNIEVGQFVPVCARTDCESLQVLSEPDGGSSKRSSLRSGGTVTDRPGSSPPPHQVLLAAAYLDDARTGSHMEFDPTLSSVRMYTTYKSWWFTGLLYLALVIVLSLAIFEQPTVGTLQSFALNKFWATVRSNWLRNVELQHLLNRL